jgi:hypothetical protein
VGTQGTNWLCPLRSKHSRNFQSKCSAPTMTMIIAAPSVKSN